MWLTMSRGYPCWSKNTSEMSLSPKPMFPSILMLLNPYIEVCLIILYMKYFRNVANMLHSE